jgi:hypothetical protein
LERFLIICRLFLIQVPFVALAALLVVVKLNISEKPASNKDGRLSKLAKVDFMGTAFLGGAIIAITSLIDQGGKSFPWRSWITVVMGGGGLLLLISFVLVEAYVAKDPIFNLRILRRPNVAISYIVGFLQVMAQLGMLFSIPLYFQVTQGASTTASGGLLVPTIIGNTVGGILAGLYVRKTGRYQLLLILAGLISCIAYVLLYFFWNGNTGFWESLYVFPGGFGTGIASAAGFVAMTATLPSDEMAMATSGYMLLISFAMTAGVTMCNSVLGIEFESQLRRNVQGPGSENIIRRAMADTDYIAHLTGQIREVVVACYLSGLKQTYVVSSVSSLAAAFFGLFIRNHQL